MGGNKNILRLSQILQRSYKKECTAGGTKDLILFKFVPLITEANLKIF